MNTRRYPRTLNEAFPNTTEYACSVEAYESTSVRLVDLLIAALFVWMVVAVILNASWLPGGQ